MSNRILANLEPERVFYYFEEISHIPRPSYHEGKISDYLAAFAREHGFDCVQDAANNVIIVRPASAGRENDPPIILQGHMDMVCEKTADCNKDMQLDGLDLFIDGDLVGAKGTTLGGDDGIAIAYALALLEDESLKTPRLEFVCTTSEEVGMGGAQAIDLSSLKGRRLLNIDSEKEGELTCGCAGGARLNSSLPIHRKAPADSAAAQYLKIRIDGLCGGHSGTEIHKGRANANMLMARILRHLLHTHRVCLYCFDGGRKDNAIPREATAIIAIEQGQSEVIRLLIEDEYRHIRAEYGTADPNIRVEVSGISEDELPAFAEEAAQSPSQTPMEFNFDAMADLVSEGSAADTDAAGGTGNGFLPISPEDTRRIVMLLLSLPNGVIRMNDRIEGLVETSLNLGILTLERDTLSITYSLRSSVEAALDALRENMIFMAEGYGAKATISSEYPAWEFVPESALREKLQRLYEEQTGRKAEVTVIHAGLECGILAGKLPGLDAVSIGPDLFDIHTPEERMSISSVARTYKWIRAVIED